MKWGSMVSSVTVYFLTTTGLYHKHYLFSFTKLLGKYVSDNTEAMQRNNKTSTSQYRFKDKYVFDQRSMLMEAV